jgi:DNA-binding CsgD family transcriptional regulator
VRTLPLFVFCLFFVLAGLGVFLADRMFRTRGHGFLRSYALHLAFWNGHALVMFMQFILGAEYLPQASWVPLGLIMGPVIVLLAAVSLYFLALFAVQAAGRVLTPVLVAVTIALWAALALFFFLKAGGGSAGPDGTFLRAYSLAFFSLKMTTVVGAMGYLLVRAGKTGGPGESRALRSVALTYLVGFLLFQLSVAGRIPLYRLPAHDYLLALLQIGYHFPVLAALAHYMRRRVAARPPAPVPPDISQQLRDLGVSPREAEIVGLVMRGFSNKEIGSELFISLETVKKHLSSIYHKLGVKSRLQLSLRIQKPPSSPSP